MTSGPSLGKGFACSEGGKSAEYLMCELDLPSRVDRIVTRCLERQYVGDLMKQMIVLSGAPAW